MATAPSLDHKAPGLGLLLREAAALAELRWKTLVSAGKAVAGARDRHPVLVLPGFLATDHSTRLFRRMLDAEGYRTHGWGMGLNLGARAETLDRIEALLDKAARREPATVIGWSLGGLFAREIAKRRPEQVRRVITLGSPFSGDARANNAWRLYELISGHPVDAPPIEVALHEKPPVETIALWSRGDGIVAPASARGLAHESDRTIEVDCTHMGFMTAPCVVEQVLELLREEDEER